MTNWILGLAPAIGAGALAVVVIIWLRRRYGSATEQDWMGGDSDGGGD